MNGKRALDISIVLCEIAGIALAGFFVEGQGGKTAVIITMAFVAVVFLVVFFKDCKREGQYARYREQGKAISQILLLSEEDTEAACWDIYGKTSIVFGRDEGRHRRVAGGQVDIDLRDTAFAATVDREHAVMNYYNGGWYLEDLESENGVGIQKAGEKRKYRVSPGTPCRVEKEDIICLGFTRLKVR